MATLTVAVPTTKWDVISRIAALEGMGVAAWMDDFLAQQIRIVLETARQTIGMDEGEFSSYLDQQGTAEKDHRQAVLDAFVEEIMASYDFDGLPAMHERTFP